MNFFQAQADARRKTGLLVCLMVLAVVSLAVMSNGLYALIMTWRTPHSHWLQFVSWESMGLFLILIFVVVLVASTIKTLVMASHGGRAVAKSMGGHAVAPATDNFYQRRLLNIVEEMALASGMPVPAVYVLHGEMGINAFAAGYGLNDAVIGVTKGTIELLSREELEGVIAHEFSHIVHGDMKLNMRLIGIIFGITMLAELGYFMLHSGGRSRSKDAMPVVIGGVGLMLIGYSGAFFGNLIRSSISRTREFLADASAVQYTRNKEGLAGALKKIGGFSHGSLLVAPQAQETSHMMFGQSVTGPLTAMFATHPPLGKRIQKLEPRWDGRFPVVRPVEADIQQESKAHGKKTAGVAGLSSSGASLHSHTQDKQSLSIVHARSGSVTEAIQSIGNPGVGHLAFASQLLRRLPLRLASHCRHSHWFSPIVIGLILSEENTVLSKQESIIGECFDQVMVARVLEVHEDLEKSGIDDRLAVLELALKGLNELSLEERTRLVKTLYQLIKADGRVTPLEWSLVTIIEHYSDKASVGFIASRPVYSLQPLRDDVLLVISALVVMSGMSHEKRQTCFDKVTNDLAFPGAVIGQKLNYRVMKDSLKRLNRLCPEAKEQLLSACCSCVEFDGQVVTAEAQALRAIALVLECPVPPVLTA